MGEIRDYQVDMAPTVEGGRIVACDKRMTPDQARQLAADLERAAYRAEYAAAYREDDIAVGKGRHGVEWRLTAHLTPIDRYVEFSISDDEFETADHIGFNAADEVRQLIAALQAAVSMIDG